MNVKCKNELAGVVDDLKAEFYGFLVSNGRIGFSSSKKSLIFTSKEYSIIRKIVKIANTLGIKRDSDVLQKEYDKLILKFDGINAVDTFKSIKKSAERFSEDKLGAFLRGVFLGCGILSTPPSYHIELRFEKQEEAKFVGSLLRKTRIKHLCKNNIIYITGRENIKNFLYEIKATNTYLVLEEDAVNKKIINETNRRTNFEFANLKRQSNASTRQVEILRQMEKEGVINDLPDELREVALLRLAHPYLSLRELSEKSGGKFTKQKLYYRLRKIISAYEK